MFNDFYKLYPRKVAKRLAEASWKKMSFTEQTMALEAITNHIKYWESTETSITFIPHPATWLNQARYEDELVIVSHETSKKKEDKSWMFSDNGILEKSKELGLSSMGLTYQQLKDKCLYVMARKAIL